MHPELPAAVIYILGQSWFTCRASRGAVNTLCPRHRYRLDASAGRYGCQPCVGAGSGYPFYPSSGRSCSPSGCRRHRRCRRRVPHQPTTHESVAGHWSPAGSPPSSATDHHPHGNEPCSARSRTRGSCPNAGRRNW